MKKTGPIKDAERSGGGGRKLVEEALRESESKLNAMLRSIPDHISVIDRELNIVWANAIATEMFGNDIIGRKCYEVYHRRKEPCEETHPCIVLKAFEDGGIHEYNTEVIDKEGKTIYFHCIANVALRDKDNKPVTVLEISRDITGRRLVEEALRKSEERFRAIANYTYDWENWVGPDGKLIWVNPAVLGFTGYSVDECLGMRDFPFPLIHEADRGRMRRFISKAHQGAPGKDVDFRVSCKDGSAKWASASWQRIYDDEGSYIGIRTSIRDITDRKKMEEEVKMHRDRLGELVAERTGQIRQEVAKRKEKEEQYLALVESIVEWVWETDANFVHTYLSPRIRNVLGYRPEELIGRSPADIMPPGEAKRALPLIRKIFSQRKPFISFQTVHLHKEGRQIFIEANGLPFFDKKGKLLGYRGSCQDITRRKKTMDELRQREEELIAKSKTLEEVNAALRVLLKQREGDRGELEGKFVSNVREMVLPYILKMQKGRPDPRHVAYLDIVKTNLNEIISPFLNTVRQLNLTPKEIEVSSLIKEGRTTKEIAELMGVAPSAINSHRNNIRAKLGLNNKKANLRSYLLSLK